MLLQRTITGVSGNFTRIAGASGQTYSFWRMDGNDTFLGEVFTQEDISGFLQAGVGYSIFSQSGIGFSLPVVSTLLNAVLVTGVGAAFAIPRGTRAIQGTVAGTGAVTAAIDIYGSATNAASGGVLVGNISLSGTTSASDGIVSDAPWPYLYCNVTALTGTGAAATVKVAV